MWAKGGGGLGGEGLFFRDALIVCKSYSVYGKSTEYILVVHFVRRYRGTQYSPQHSIGSRVATLPACTYLQYW